MTIRRRVNKPLTGLLLEIHRVLMHSWDPLGAAGEPRQIDEYDAYILEVHDLLISNASAAQIAAYLKNVETLKMCGCGSSDEHLMNAALNLVDLVRG